MLIYVLLVNIAAHPTQVNVMIVALMRIVIYIVTTVSFVIIMYVDTKHAMSGGELVYWIALFALCLALVSAEVLVHHVYILIAVRVVIRLVVF
jgi:hypothetical protein